MAETTQASIAEQIRPMLSEDWAIHVDDRRSYQIPDKPSIRRGKMVSGYYVYVRTFRPIYLAVFVHAETLPKLKKRIDNGDLWTEIKKEFEKQAVTLTPDQLAALGATQHALPRSRQLALTHQ